MIVIRSAVFHLAFFIWSVLCCIAFLPIIFFPKQVLIKAIMIYLHGVDRLERWILNLHYVIEGRDHVPQEGPFLIAAKHQSQYETLKLHFLFNDPAVILKQELLAIPLWGKYLQKLDIIAIDRSDRRSAMNSIIDGAKRMKEQGRPIVIFPQGTRVNINTTPNEKPYKQGIVRMYEATDLPIIPMALNSGYFWPKKGWLRKSGTVTFRFLPPIPPGHDPDIVLKDLEHMLENESNALVEAATDNTKAKQKSLLRRLAISMIILVMLYTVSWFSMAGIIQNHLRNTLPESVSSEGDFPTISGFPGPMQIKSGVRLFQTEQGNAKFDQLFIKFWPLPLIPSRFEISHIGIDSILWDQAMTFDTIEGNAMMSLDFDTITLSETMLGIEDKDIRIDGEIYALDQAIPEALLNVKIGQPSEWVDLLVNRRILEEQQSRWIKGAISAFPKDTENRVILTISLRSGSVYLGPIRVARLTAPPAETQHIPPAQ